MRARARCYGAAMRSLLLVVSVVALTACGGYKKDVETICNVRARAGVSADAGADAQADAIATYLMLHVHTPKAKKMMATMGSKSLAEKAAVLAREAKAEGVSPCPLADEYTAPAAAH